MSRTISDDAAAAAMAAHADATRALALLAIDPQGVGGVVLHAAAGEVRDQWLRDLATLLPEGTPLPRVPIHIADDRLLGGLDLGASLRAGHPVAQRGLLAQADGGVVLLAMAERLEPAMVARLSAVLDQREVVVQRDGIASRQPARIACVALDEGFAPEEAVAPALVDRLALRVDLDALGASRSVARDRPGFLTGVDREAIARARRLLPDVTMDDAVIEALCGAAAVLGIASIRAPMLAVRVARAAAALDGRSHVDDEDAACAARLVLAHRATRLPATEPPADDDPGDPPLDDETPDAPSDDATQEPPAEPSPSEAPDTPPPPPPDAEDLAAAEAQALDEVVLAAAKAAIPPGLLAALMAGEQARARARTHGKAGAMQKSRLRGRPAGVIAGMPGAGVRLNLIDTLRAAAPWQRLRQHEATVQGAAPGAHVLIRREDFRITRFRQRRGTATLFVVDASGSSALNRLAEAKGAVELLLADCYVRRDRVAVIAFRGASAELLLPPTRSLVRAKRGLAGLPGGGGTPLSHAIDAARELADSIAQKGETPTAVFLTDGRANIARDGTPGRARANDDAMASARQWRAAGHAALLLDSAPQPQESARLIAQAMGATYLPLPRAGAADMSRVVRAATAPSVPRG